MSAVTEQGLQEEIDMRKNEKRADTLTKIRNADPALILLEIHEALQEAHRTWPNNNIERVVAIVRVLDKHFGDKQ